MNFASAIGKKHLFCGNCKLETIRHSYYSITICVREFVVIKKEDG